MIYFKKHPTVKFLFAFSYCKKNFKRCSKESGHRGPCNKDRKLHDFHTKSPILLNANRKKLQSDIEIKTTELSLCILQIGITIFPIHHLFWITEIAYLVIQFTKHSVIFIPLLSGF